MASQYDLIIRQGLIVDGNGGEPYVGDVAVKDGCIAALGTVDGSATDEIDAFDDDKPHGSVVTEAAGFEDTTEFGASETPNTHGRRRAQRLEILEQAREAGFGCQRHRQGKIVCRRRWLDERREGFPQQPGPHREGGPVVRPIIASGSRH